MTKRERDRVLRGATLMECEECRQVVLTYVPRHGDGTARRVYAHATNGKRCPGLYARGWESDRGS